jgi:hypothetical protein
VQAGERDRQAHSFRDLALSGQPSTDYVPQPIVSIPIYLRKKIQYYKDSADAVRKQLDILWDAYSQAPGADRDEFVTLPRFPGQFASWTIMPHSQRL